MGNSIPLHVTIAGNPRESPSLDPVDPGVGLRAARWRAAGVGAGPGRRAVAAVVPLAGVGGSSSSRQSATESLAAFEVVGKQDRGGVAQCGGGRGGEGFRGAMDEQDRARAAR